MRYRPGLDLVLKDLSLHVCGGEKVRMGWVCARDVAIPLVGSVGLWENRCSIPVVCLASLGESRRCPH